MCNTIWDSQTIRIRCVVVITQLKVFFRIFCYFRVSLALFIFQNFLLFRDIVYYFVVTYSFISWRSFFFSIWSIRLMHIHRESAFLEFCVSRRWAGCYALFEHFEWKFFVCFSVHFFFFFFCSNNTYLDNILPVKSFVEFVCAST